MLSVHLRDGIYPDKKNVNPLADCLFECADYISLGPYIEKDGLNPEQTSSFFRLFPLRWNDRVAHIIKQRHP